MEGTKTGIIEDQEYLSAAFLSSFASFPTRVLILRNSLVNAHERTSVSEEIRQYCVSFSSWVVAE